MIISNRRRFIFIHNYKVAGTSVRKELMKYGLDIPPKSKVLLYLLELLPLVYANYILKMLRKFNLVSCLDVHDKADIVKKIIGKKYNDYFTFGLVRNPWDWQVSFYFYIKQTPTHHQHSVVKNMTFHEYLVWRTKDENIIYQKDFFYEDNNKIVNYIGKFENIELFISRINNNLNLNLKLGHINKSSHQNYKKYYNEETWNIVKNSYEKDIDLFEYNDTLK